MRSLSFVSAQHSGGEREACCRWREGKDSVGSDII